MAHQIETILAALVTTLKAANTDALTRVYRGRTLPVEASEGGGDVINIYEDDESIDLNDVNFFKIRNQTVNVELHKRDIPDDVNDPGAVDAAANEFLRQVEVAIEADFRLGGTCMAVQHVGTRRDRADADQEFRVITVNLNVRYRTQRTDPEVQA